MIYRILKTSSVLAASLTLLANVFCTDIIACTAFSIKTDDNVYHGKNWDFRISNKDEVTFHLYELEDGRSLLSFEVWNSLCSAINSDGFITTVNDDNTLRNLQSKPNFGLEFPENTDWSKLTDPYNLAYEAQGFATVADLKYYIKDTAILGWGYPGHTLFADKTGTSCVIEADDKKGYANESQSNFLLMTNFPLYSMQSLDNLNNVPCSRYKAAYKVLEENESNFNVITARNALKASRQSSTIYSFVYDANENAVYLYLYGHYENVWKFSFATKTLSTYQGFVKQASFTLNSEGLTLTKLWDFQTEHMGSIMGDLNGDGNVTLPDAQLALRASLGIIELNDEQVADVNKDGQVTLSDAQTILKISLGIISLS